MVKFGCQVADQYMNHPEEFTKMTPNHIVKWVLKERQHPPHAWLLLVLQQIKSSKSFHGLLKSSRTAKFTYANKSNNISSNKGQRSSEDNHIMGVLKTHPILRHNSYLQPATRISTTLAFLAILGGFSLSLFLEAKYPATKVRPKILAQVLSCLSI